MAEDGYSEVLGKIAQVEGALPTTEQPQMFDGVEIGTRVGEQPVCRVLVVACQYGQVSDGGGFYIGATQFNPVVAEIGEAINDVRWSVSSPQCRKFVTNGGGHSIGDGCDIGGVLIEEREEAGVQARRRSNDGDDVVAGRNAGGWDDCLGILGDGQAVAVGPAEQAFDLPRGAVALEEVVVVRGAEQGLQLGLKRVFFGGPLRVVGPEQEVGDVHGLEETSRLAVGAVIDSEFGQSVEHVTDDGSDAFAAAPVGHVSPQACEVRLGSSPEVGQFAGAVFEAHPASGADDAVDVEPADTARVVHDEKASWFGVFGYRRERIGLSGLA